MDNKLKTIEVILVVNADFNKLNGRGGNWHSVGAKPVNPEEDLNYQVYGSMILPKRFVIKGLAFNEENINEIAITKTDLEAFRDWQKLDSRENILMKKKQEITSEMTSQLLLMNKKMEQITDLDLGISAIQILKEKLAFNRLEKIDEKAKKKILK